MYDVLKKTHMLGCSIKIFDAEEVYEENGVENTAHQDKYCGGTSMATQNPRKSGQRKSRSETETQAERSQCVWDADRFLSSVSFAPRFWPSV